ncbi:MAG: flavodoxin-dependent (E)-4-hydroxy-3-methylbut-2-enyl-diphosphate synthase [Thermoleophilia bacterium]|nr:flavodoxin-dependent (E)-4-hydroxy-3-methylbut-2-enyl-diphosphate synthase [Thermoleophilia bacterium]
MASKRSVQVGRVTVGGGAPVAVQSMTTTQTNDPKATLAQIHELFEAGCEIVRVAVPGLPDARALPEIVKFSPLPVVADIHFNASLALKAIEANVACVRINPGNIGGDEKVIQVVEAAKAKNIPIRIGMNMGSLPMHLRSMAVPSPAEALVEGALEEVRLLERMGYFNYKISVKASDPVVMVNAYRQLAAKVDCPLHLGVTEAGTPCAGTIKSADGPGSLLLDGIGDTIRVSLTAPPVEEVRVAWEILKATGLRKKGFNMIACPSCGRADVEIVDLAGQVEERLLADYGDEIMEIAVMGCAVNGPGEAGNADFGIAGGRLVGFLYAHGEVLRKVPQAQLVDELFKEIDAWIAAGKPERRDRAAFGKHEGADDGSEPLAGPKVTLVGHE